VLVVDDNDDIRDALVAALEAEGHRAVGVANGADALAYMRHGEVRPCLILLDLMMPDMDGITFRQAQLADETLAGIPIAVVSAYSRLRRAAALEPVAYLSKPVNFDELFDVVRTYCRRDTA
jgi:CheY-like chemotaxis protein